MRTGVRSAAGWSRVLSLAVLLSSLPAWGLGGITDPQVDPRAANAIQSFKLDFSYTSDLAFTTARTTQCAKMGIKCDAIQEGMLYYRTTDNVIRYYDGAAWQSYAPPVGAGITLDDAYTAGASIIRDLGTISISDAMANAVSTLTLTRTAGTGAVLDINNTGTGNDITGDLWSVSTAGEITAVALTLGDDQSVNLGDATDAIVLWDTTGTDHLEFSALVDSTEVHWDEDQHGLDQKWWGDTATAGDGMFFDASAVELSFLKTAAAAAAKILLGYDDILSFGDSSEFTIKYDDDTTATYLVGVAGEEVYVGSDGLGMDVIIYSDTAGSSAQFVETQDSLVLTNYTIRMGDDDQIKFGATSDATIEWVDGSGWLLVDAAGSTPVHFGAEDDGLDMVWYDDAAAGTESLTWDAIDAVTNGSRLEFVGSDAYFDNNAHILLGSGLTDTGNGDIDFYYKSADDVLQIKQVVPGAGVDGTGSVSIGVDGEGIDTTLWGETAGDYCIWDQDTGAGEAALRFVAGPDIVGDASFAVTLGATDTVTPADGIKLSSTATVLSIDGVSAGANEIVTGAARQMNLSVYGTNAGGAPAEMVRWNYGSDQLAFLTTASSSGYLRMSDKAPIEWGNYGANADVRAYWDVGAAPAPGGETDYLRWKEGATANPVMMLGEDGEGWDLVLQSEAPSAYTWFDQTSNAWTLVNGLVRIPAGTATDDAIQWGATAGGDIRQYHSTGSVGLVFDPAAAGQRVYFGAPGGAGPLDVQWIPSAGATWLMDDDAGTDPYVYHDDVHLVLDQDSPIYFDPTALDVPTDGIAMHGDSAAASDKLYIYALDGAGTAGDVVIGYSGAADYGTNMTWHGSAGGAGAKMRWDYATSSLTFPSATSNSWYADNAYIGWGNTQAAPDALLSWDATKLFLDTGNGADITFQLGTAAANHKVATVFGDPATKGVTINPNTATENGRIAYNTVMAMDYIWLPAANFVAGTPNHNAAAGHAADVYSGRLGSSKMGGWIMDVNDAADDEIDTTWTPPTWVQGASDVTVKIVWATSAAEGACVLAWELCYLMLDVESAPGGRTGVNDALTCVETDFTYNAGAASYEINRTASITIPAASVERAVSTGRSPIAITIRHDDDDAQETCTSDIQVLGLEMNVARAYVD